MTRRRRAYPKAPREWRKYMADLFGAGYSVIDRGPKGFSVDKGGRTLVMERGPVENVLAQAAMKGLADVSKAPAFGKVAGGIEQGDGKTSGGSPRRRVRKQGVAAEIERLESILAAGGHQTGDAVAGGDAAAAVSREAVARRLLGMAEALLRE